MKKILIAVAATLSAFCGWLAGITPYDFIDAAWYCVDMINALVSAFIHYIIPPQEGIKSYIISGYLGARSFFGKMFGWQPFSIYDHMLDRAKANPLEAFGAIALIAVMIWLIIFKYRMLYRFYHWLLVTRSKKR